jgi:hypothetical protein
VWAREIIAPQEDPAPSGGRMSEGQEGGCYPSSLTFAKSSIDIEKILLFSIYYSKILYNRAICKSQFL